MARIKLKPLKEQVVVITGASSGIGLVTAPIEERGGHPGHVANYSLYTKSRLYPLATVAILAGAGAVLARRMAAALAERYRHIIVNASFLI